MVDAGDVAVAVGSEAFDLWLVMLKFRAWLVVILLLVVGMSYFAMSDWGIEDEARESSSSVNSDTGWRHYSVVAPVDTGIKQPIWIDFTGSKVIVVYVDSCINRCYNRIMPPSCIRSSQPQLYYFI